MIRHTLSLTDARPLSNQRSAYSVETSKAGTRLLTFYPFHSYIPHWWHLTRRSATPSARPGTACSALTVGVPKEVYANEKRVAIAPANVRQLTKEIGRAHV